ncbi:putative tail fiber protein [Escherichia phage vB_EcoD_Teewinot]|uniref:Tail fiber protein n=1 Tax=Escherichia phage vB_EcoD_Teewinot TaxID=2894796 RepID=A0AAE8YYF1_9CAUD|nr:putative tail fiber protein [Escherichia phage vB_EcoD_Teewinot]UGO51147.1 putative tail fiber protein [Escherichia phage vB_EcoD_Teewinot]
MAAGTLSVTNNSTAVVGVGTTFTAFKAGDFLTLVVGQVPYTVAIASIESNTALTLVLPFDGPTATGLAWDGVKRDTMSLATMGVTVQAQKALRLMIADENNWRAIFGDAEEITVTLPNGQVMQGMSWGYLSKLLKNVDLVEMRDLAAQAEASKLAAQGFRDQAEEWARQRFGIIAEEAELIAPQYVKHHEFPIEDILDEDGNKIGEKMTDRPSIDVNPIVMDLMGCVQYLNKQVEELKAEIAALKK